MNTSRLPERKGRREFIKKGAQLCMAAGFVSFADLRQIVAETVQAKKPIANPTNIRIHLSKVLNNPKLFDSAISQAKGDVEKYIRSNFSLLPEQEKYFRTTFNKDRQKWSGYVDELQKKVTLYRSRHDVYPQMKPKVTDSGMGDTCPDDGLGVVADEDGVYFCASVCCISICIPVK